MSDPSNLPPAHRSATRRLSIAMIDPAAYSLPYDTALCSALAARGHKVTLYTTRFAHGPMPAADGYEIVEWFYRRSGRPLPRRYARGAQHPFDVRRLRRHLTEQAVDIAHVQWSVLDALDLSAWPRLPMPTIFTAHNATPREGRGESVPPDKLQAFDAVVAHSTQGAAALQKAGVDPVWQIPHGALDQYSSAAEPDAAPVNLGDGPVVVMAGLLRDYKGVDVLLDAWPAVREAVPDAQLVIAGRPVNVDLPDQPPAGATIVPRFLTDEEYAWLLRRADVTCLPYRAIDLSGVLFSSMALGTPLVMSGVGGFLEFDGHGAELVAPADPAALATGLIKVLQDDDLRSQLALEALTAAQGPFAWSTIAETYERRYTELLDRAPARA